MDKSKPDTKKVEEMISEPIVNGKLVEESESETTKSSVDIEDVTSSNIETKSSVAISATTQNLEITAKAESEVSEIPVINQISEKSVIVAENPQVANETFATSTIEEDKPNLEAEKVSNVTIDVGAAKLDTEVIATEMKAAEPEEKIDYMQGYRPVQFNPDEFKHPPWVQTVEVNVVSNIQFLLTSFLVTF